MIQTTHQSGPIRPTMDDDDDEESTGKMRAPTVDSGKADRLNPEVEYEVLDLASESPAALKTRLNELGREGWQLVATSPAFVFRRMKKPEDEKKSARVGFNVR